MGFCRAAGAGYTVGKLPRYNGDALLKGSKENVICFF